jgi:hypothetical protein
MNEYPPSQTIEASARNISHFDRRDRRAVRVSLVASTRKES